MLINRNSLSDRQISVAAARNDTPTSFICTQQITMENKNSSIGRTTILYGAKEPQRLLRQNRRTSPNRCPEDRSKKHIEQLKQPLKTKNNNGEGNFHAFSDQVLPEEQPAHLKTAPTIRPTEGQILACDAGERIEFHVEKELTRTLMDAVASGKNIDILAT